MSTRLWLCADGGGTGVRVAISDQLGSVVARGSGGPCNLKVVGAATALLHILYATTSAIQQLDNWKTGDAAGSETLPKFEKIWLGIAGINSQQDADDFALKACTVFGIDASTQPGRIRVSDDAALLACASDEEGINICFVVIAGTGSVCLAYEQERIQVRLLAQRGGFGHLLGDEGSGYAIGLAAIKFLLERNQNSPEKEKTEFEVDLYRSFKVTTADQLLNKIYAAAAESERKVWIASAAEIVLRHAFPQPGKTTAAAMLLLTNATNLLVDQFADLVSATRANFAAEASPNLILSGSLFKSPDFKNLFHSQLKLRHSIEFAKVRVVQDAAGEAVQTLVAIDS